MNLDRGQRKIARQLLDVGTRRKESRKEKLAALVTALTEANLGNPNYGDRDSVGWRQERSHYGPVSKRLNVRGGAKRFYNETSSAGAAKGGTVGELAQAVQRSAFPDRYQTQVGSAKEILAAYNQGRLGKPPVASGKRSKATRTSKRTYTTPGTDLSAERSQARIALLTGSKGLPSSGELLAYKTTMAGLKDVPGTKRTVTTRSRTRGKPEAKGSVKGLTVKKDQNMGAKSLAEYATKGIYTSGERTPAQNAAVGGAASSDHLTTNRMASAADAKYGTGKLIAKRLGIKGWKPGNYDRHTITVKGRKYSVQILEDVDGHWDHTHVGIARV